MIKVFDTTQEFADYSQNGLKIGELCYVAEDKTAHFKTTGIDEVPAEDDNQYTEFNISTASSIHLAVNSGDSFEVYNPDHVQIMLYCTTSDDMYASAGVMGDYEHMYLTCGNQVAYFESITPGFFNVMLAPGVSGNYTIYYRKLN